MRAALDPEAEARSLTAAYGELIRRTVRRLLEAAPAGLADGVDAAPLPECFAVGLGVSGGVLLDHLDPSLGCLSRGYRHRPDLPTAQIPELLAMMRAPRLLDLLEGLLGPEIEAAPTYHTNFKLPKAELARSRRVARACARSMRRGRSSYDLHVRTTPLHMDATYGLPDSWSSEIVTAWIPLTESREENGCLCVVPGSHTRGVRPGPYSEEEMRRALAVESRPGDVILMHNRLLHGSTPNVSDGDFRWSVNFRYAPRGHPTGRPWLPGFNARSRAEPERELRDGAVWAAMWNAALAHASAPRRWIPGPGPVAADHAEAVGRYWREQMQEPEDWLALPPAPRWRRWRLFSGIRGS